MARINIMGYDDNDEPRLIGWFSEDAAERFAEYREAFDGANLAGVHLRDQNRGQTLYHTARGRWVLAEWSRWQGETTSYRYIDDDAARDWLIVNGDDDEIERLFGEPVEEERAPIGRPEIGPQIMTRIRPEMLTQIDKEAERRGLSRAETMRQLLQDGLTMASYEAQAERLGTRS